MATIAGGFIGIVIVLLCIEESTFMIPAAGFAFFFWMATYGNIKADRKEKLIAEIQKKIATERKEEEV